MSQLPPSPPPGYYPPPSPVGPSGRGEPPKLIAILALVFGAAALLLGLLPVAGIFFGGIFGTAAIVLGIIGLLKSHKVMSTMGIALAVVGTIVSWAIAGAVFNAADYEDGAADPPTSSAEPTTETATRQPTTSAEPTQEPTTSAEPTQEPTTSAEPTQEPTTSAEPTQEPTTSAEPTEAPTTEAEPTTSAEPTENSGGQAEGSFGDGTWTVGEDIEAGTYSTTVPDDSFGCYWERLSGFSGGLDDIITNAIIQPGATATVTIDSSDAGFTSDGCGTWEQED
jgi:outer membrane biosynthesis protein TonB